MGYINLRASHPLGILRGLETFLQLVLPNPPNEPRGFYLPGIVIHDEPRFFWRGLSLDSSRHFISLNGVKRTIDGMAAVKLNVLHWHLSDDEGFRVESKKFPRLQQFGSDGQFYKQSEILEIVRYARDRGIRIVPEFDVPGHSSSWFPGYPNLASGHGPYHILRQPVAPDVAMDPTKESTYRFLDGFIGEMAALFPDEYFHIGGDEVNAKVWTASPIINRFMQLQGFSGTKDLQAYFTSRVERIASRHGKRVVGWDDVLRAGTPKTVIVESYRDQKSLGSAVRQGYRGLLSTGYYLDLMLPASDHYIVDPLEGDTGPLTPAEQRRVLGGEAAMWGEIATEENLDAKLWPRLAAIAERFWSPETTKDISFMYQRLEPINQWLEWLGLTQRSNLELMRQRLGGKASASELDTFITILEPVKNFERQPHYNTFTPLNHLVDAIPPESNAARIFSQTVIDYLKSRDADQARQIRDQLQTWLRSARLVRPILESNALLTENTGTADAVEQLCLVGIQSVDALTNGTSLNSEWKRSAEAAIEGSSKPHAETLVPITSSIRALTQIVSISK